MSSLNAQSFCVHPQLASYIAHITFGGVTSTVRNPLHYTYPWSTAITLSFYFGDSFLLITKGATDYNQQHRKCFLVGPQLLNNHLVFMPGDCGAVGFQPAAFYLLTGIPVSEIMNQEIEASLIFGKEIYSLHEQLENEQEWYRRAQLTQNWLFSLIKRAKAVQAVDLAIRMLAQNTNHISIESLSNQFFLSRRQFERKSKERVGVSPQLFSRINRFTRAYKMRETCSGHTWTQIAHASGYYDQAHFIRDFKTFSGILPTMVDERLSDSIRLLSALEGFE